ncbi:MAG: prepilin peptidase [Stagnimonas sp.]|nr:prepilin peptidase [Stagnimonas sp.]
MSREAIVAALLIWAVLVAIVDWRSRKVPNLLLLAVLLPAGAVCFWRGQGLLGVSLPGSFIGLVVALLLTLPGYLVSRFGAGDVKLAAVMGFLQGSDAVLLSLLLAALLLGAMSLLMVLQLGLESARKLRLPAAVALSGGFVGVLLVSYWGNL